MTNRFDKIIAETPCYGVVTTGILGVLRLRAHQFFLVEFFMRVAQDDSVKKYLKKAKALLKSDKIVVLPRFARDKEQNR